MNESQFQDKVKKELENDGYFCYVPFNTTRGGVPDLYCAKDGIAFWLELKYHKASSDMDEVTLSHQVSAQQSSFLRKCQTNAGVLIGFEDGKYLLVRSDELVPGPNKKFKIDELFDNLDSALKTKFGGSFRA